jgi:hypothetical protein
MKKHTKPPEPPPEDSLVKLAEFTKRILQVPRSELPSKHDFGGPKKIDEPCPD